MAATVKDLPKLKEAHGNCLHAFVGSRDVEFFGSDAEIVAKKLEMKTDKVDGQSHIALRRDLWTDYCAKILDPPIPILMADGNPVKDGNGKPLYYDICQN